MNKLKYKLAVKLHITKLQEINSFEAESGIDGRNTIPFEHRLLDDNSTPSQ